MFEGARRTGLAYTLALMASSLGAPAGADVWDTQMDNDNSSNTDNELVHGTEQIHDLAALPGPAADNDWYAIGQNPFSSYEIVVDSTSGDIFVSGEILQRVIQTGAPVQSSLPIGPGLFYSRSLRWENTTGTAVANEWIRVRSSFCTTNCNADDVYRIRAYETTIAVPRYNNAGGQVTVLILQNPASYTAAGNVYLWGVGGTMTTSYAFSVPAKGASITNLSTVNGGVANNTGGTVTIAHDARYGDLTVKTVAVDPASGFSFDAPGSHRPH